MTDEKLWLLISLQLSGEATPAELQELEKLLQQDPLLGERAAVFAQLWRTRYALQPGTAMPFDRHLQRLSNHLGAPVLQFEEEWSPIIPKRKPLYTRWWLFVGIAASLLLIILLTQVGTKINTAPSRLAANTISTKPGSKSKVELPDGTQVWLNADSKLAYSGDFTGKTREVSLTGEAFFDVVKDRARPFIIHTSTVQIKVLGTAFNVRSYPSDKTTETALIRGSVEVTLNGHPEKKVVLRPNEKVVIDNAGAESNTTTGKTQRVAAPEPMVVGNVHIDKEDKEVYETMWVKNKLAFDETPFDNMIAEIERWYNVSIIVKKPSLSTGTYTVTFENKSLDEVLEALKFSAHFQYLSKDGVVSIW